MLLRNEHIPDDVLKQPELVMSSFAAQALRPLLNRWLGGFQASQDGRATDGDEAEKRMWETLRPGTLLEFTRKEGGRPVVGEVADVSSDTCSLYVLDFWSGGARIVSVKRSLVTRILRPAIARRVHEI
eukprot:gnl/TRDRNA2_/TRDRNA2_153243_c1_seq1.p2 gnl/TRDRNA2_/TRDRNA2_153243_c1~~gnl/TRDRNA2_/TRDRNA2_153243_c1_seq1.p2  ORF type:complete len:128 (+),score=20.29 gnl/TRDRNA2_/TRDRNA2_153243_c1_seq1:121-504(+)